jgi:CheY-like chemotaxis protein
MFSVEVQRAIKQTTKQTTKQILSKSVTALSDEFPKDRLIAVVDDEVRILDATRLLLEQWGCTVIVATCGKDLIAQLATSSRVPDAIISDYRLRDEETGIDVIANLRSEFNTDIPAILITGDTSPERISAFSSTDFTVLYKPMQDIVLKKTLSQLIKLSASVI